MRVVLTYDISSDGRRARLFKRLKKLLNPVQFSVFEGDLPPAELGRLEHLLGRTLDLGTDSVRVYSLCRACAGLGRVYGVAPELPDPDAPLIVGE